MKKTYINPTIEVVNIKAPQLLAGSPEVPKGSSGSADDAEGRYDDWDW
ncbi:MAG: hypothetical protein IJV13_04705 [Prevotella sp.]|nr:hypothetical protein [Prevotella sp.]